MNPTSIGGGRSKLPRSIRNLFSVVSLNEYQDNELFLIVRKLFDDLILEKYLTPDQVQALFKFYIELRQNLMLKKIGRIGGPYEINLRDFTKLHDVLKENYNDLKHHLNFYSKEKIDHDGDLSSMSIRSDSDTMTTNEDSNFDSSFIIEQDTEFNGLALKKFLELIFAKQYHSYDDQNLITSLINKYLPVNNNNLNKVWDDSNFFIDNTVEDTIRIGTVYLKKEIIVNENTDAMNSFSSSSSGGHQLIHTKETCEQLEILAAAVKSKRAILLEGETCSRKTSLVKELSQP